jgi:V8-like Glu-specific endopeptidase
VTGVSLTAFGLPADQVRPYIIPSTNTTHRPAICRTGSFTAVDQSTLNTQYPMTAMGRFYFTFVPDGAYGTCSAMLIGPDTILTAVHCVYDCDTGAEINYGVFYLQLYGDSFQAIRRAVRWVGVRQCRDFVPTHDFAVVKLESRIDGVPIPPTVRSTARALSTSRLGREYGYPGETKPGNIPYFSENDNILWSLFQGQPSRVLIDMSGEKGSSGGPLFLAGLPTNVYRQSNAIIGVASFQFFNNSCPNGFAAFQPGWNPEMAKTILQALD